MLMTFNNQLNTFTFGRTGISGKEQKWNHVYCTYGYVHTYVHTAMYTRTYIWLCTHVCTYSYVHTYVHMAMYTRTYIWLCTHVCTYGYVHTLTSHLLTQRSSQKHVGKTGHDSSHKIPKQCGGSSLDVRLFFITKSTFSNPLSAQPFRCIRARIYERVQTILTADSERLRL